MTISKDKTYTTRNGLPVRIYATDGGGLYPVHGAYFMPTYKVWFCQCWTDTGNNNRSFLDANDLIEVKPKPKSKPKKPTKKAVKR